MITVIKTNLWKNNVKFQIIRTNYKLVAFIYNSENKSVTILQNNLKNFNYSGLFKCLNKKE